MIDIRSKSEDPRAARLSNFTERKFIFDSVACNSLEGFLQSLKFPDVDIQRDVCRRSGRYAKLSGPFDPVDILYWNRRIFSRHDSEYLGLITRAYDAVYEQDATFAQDLLASGNEELRHTIGKANSSETILTEAEFLCQLYRLRARAHTESLAIPELPELDR